ncbi:hemerythrin domain-containing protein [Nocardia thailandica]
MTDDPTAVPDLLGISLAHRAMLADTAHLAAVAADIACGRSACGPRRAAAVAGYLRDLCASVHHHHRIEDTVLWPALAEAAGAAVDLRELSDDHAELDPLLAEVDTAAAGLVASGAAGAPALAEALRRLHDVLTEHIADEERTVFPAVRAHVHPDRWADVEAAARAGAKMRFELPRMAAVCTPEEWARATGGGGLPLRVMLAVFGVGHRRRRRAIAGG